MTEQPAEQTPATPQPESAPPSSIADHAAQFGPQAVHEDDPAEDAPAEPLTPIRPVDQQKRDQGKFAEGRRPLKAKDAVERINQLTGRAKTAEEKLAAAEVELSRLRTQHAPPAAIAKAEAKVEQAQPAAERTTKAGGFAEPEPSEDDPKFEGDYGKYLRAAAAWEGRKAYHEARAAEQAQAARAQQTKTMDQRLTAAQAKYPDFDAAASRVFARIPPQSALEAWIFAHKHGDDVLYYFDQHQQDLDAILRMPTPLEQFEAVTLLSQRIASPQRSEAGTTGSASPRNVIVLPPRPPNPVRTEAQRASEDPPTDGSLSIAEHAKHFAKRR